MTRLPVPVTIRPANAADAASLARLAALDSSVPPEAPMLVAEVEGELRAAVSLWDGSAIADPFHRSAALVALLHGHIERTRDGARRRSRLTGTLSPRRATRDRRRRQAPARARWRAA